MSVPGPAGSLSRDLRRVPVAVAGHDRRAPVVAGAAAIAPVDEHQAVLGRVDQHVLGQHRAVHDAGPVGEAERDQQPPPHPGRRRAGRARPGSARRPRRGCASPCAAAEHVDPPFGAGRLVAVPERVHQPGHVRQVARVAVARRAAAARAPRGRIRSLSAGPRASLSSRVAAGTSYRSARSPAASRVAPGSAVRAPRMVPAGPCHRVVHAPRARRAAAPRPPAGRPRSGWSERGQLAGRRAGRRVARRTGRPAVRAASISAEGLGGRIAPSPPGGRSSAGCSSRRVAGAVEPGPRAAARAAALGGRAGALHEARAPTAPCGGSCRRAAARPRPSRRRRAAR